MLKFIKGIPCSIYFLLQKEKITNSHPLHVGYVVYWLKKLWLFSPLVPLTVCPNGQSIVSLLSTIHYIWHKCHKMELFKNTY